MRTQLTTFLVAATLLVTGIGTAHATGEDVVVRTDAGQVRGTAHSEDGAGYRTFEGIPYAAPPVGDLRWSSPRPAQPWTGVRDATQPSGPCAQSAGGGSPSTTEDCLYLNVTTPDTRRPKPVMVWLHGGGLSWGSGSVFDPHRLAVRGDVVVVTVNYRLGLFGFLGHEGLADSGAYGLEDQQAALRWVQRNAAAFGGDPRRVTLFGESGGAWAVCGQLTAPGSRGLFHRAIIQSGTCASSPPANGIRYGDEPMSSFRSLAAAHADGAALAAAHGCDDAATAVACLRALTPDELNTGYDSMVMSSVAYGTRILPEHPSAALAAGRFNRVPVITGTTRDEGRLATAYSEQPFTEDVYQRLLGEAYGDQAARVGARYPSSAFGSPGLAWSAVLTDGVWACAQLSDARRATRWAPVYGFEFADRQAPTGYFDFPADLPPGAFHSSEVAYLLDVEGFVPDFTQAQLRLADRMIGYWSRFAATGDPGWPRLRDSNVQSLAPGAIQQVDYAATHDCGFWANV
jgi:para-nitrobenzyl esterase